jgi:methanol--5-hydroxybenzimidazolylcobamide Co-methyltransferase
VLGQTRFTALAINDPKDLVFGRAPKPIECGFGLRIGAGQVLPEVNFTLPAISVSSDTWPAVLSNYREVVEKILRRAVALQPPGVVLEFELLPAMTDVPEWGAEITALLRRHLQEAHERHGLKSALRVTPTDIRDQTRPPLLRQGAAWERLAGADIISIESVGGKEVHDPALLYGDVRGMVFGLGVLAARDMAWLWGQISQICAASGKAIPGGDSACGFANTAMQLANQKMLPEVLAAVVRAMGAARSLVAFEHGAIGPSKDCAYEGPVIKAITGRPISMEGKSASCAHFSPVGNIAAAACDLWSNESVQNVRLLSGSAPEAYTELLIYDCRLMNAAIERGGAGTLRDWLVESDRWLSPQAAVLSPEATCEIAGAIVREPDDYHRTIAAGQAGVRIIEEATNSGQLRLSEKEQRWLSRIKEGLCTLPCSEDQLLNEMRGQYGDLFDVRSYGLGD